MVINSFLLNKVGHTNTVAETEGFLCSTDISEYFAIFPHSWHGNRMTWLSVTIFYTVFRFKGKYWVSLFILMGF